MANPPGSDAVERVLSDLAAEHDDLASLVADIDEAAWRTATPAEGWDVADSISHLWFFDIRAALAIRDHEGFARDTAEMMANFAKGGDPSVAHGRAVRGATSPTGEATVQPWLPPGVPPTHRCACRGTARR